MVQLSVTRHAMFTIDACIYALERAISAAMHIQYSELVRGHRGPNASLRYITSEFDRYRI